MSAKRKPSAASKAASRRWDAKNLMVLGTKVRRERAAKLKAYAAEEGTNISALLAQALRDLEARHEPIETPTPSEEM